MSPSEGQDRPIADVAGNGWKVRRAGPDDAAAVAALANALNRQEGKPDDLFCAERVRADALGPDAFLTTLVAEADGAVVGYAFVHDAYNSDLAERSLWLLDIFVAPGFRRRGIGRGLIAVVARLALARGLRSIEWGVRGSNRRARAFYAALGATDEGIRILGFDGAAITALAARPEG